MPIEPIAAPRLYEHIADAIAALIEAGEFAPGERLPGERTLAAKLGVSRTSLREALAALELAGRVTIRVGSGVYVRAARDRRGVRAASRTRGETSPFDVFRARRLVEAETAALAARHASPAQLRALEAAFERLAADMRENRVVSRADRRFHTLIAEASGNTAFAQIVEALWAQQSRPLTARMESLFVTPGRKRDNVGEHRRILDAIRARDPVAARKAMRVHLANAERQRLAETRGRP